MTTAAPSHEAMADPLAGAGDAPATEGRRIARALLRDRGAVLSTVFLGLVVLMAICAPLISAVTGHGPNDFDPAAVDTNLRRVLSRWHGDVLDGARLENAARTDLDEAAAAWNHAMTDLGATVCLPRHARCEECPVESWCAGPGVYEPPRPQPRFEGSLRQVRGALVRALVAGEADFDDLVAASGFSADRVEEAIDSLIEDDLVVETEQGFTLSE